MHCCYLSTGSADWIGMISQFINEETLSFIEVVDFGDIVNTSSSSLPHQIYRTYFTFSNTSPSPEIG